MNLTQRCTQQTKPHSLFVTCQPYKILSLDSDTIIATLNSIYVSCCTRRTSSKAKPRLKSARSVSWYRQLDFKGMVVDLFSSCIYNIWVDVYWCISFCLIFVVLCGWPSRGSICRWAKIWNESQFLTRPCLNCISLRLSPPCPSPHTDINIYLNVSAAVLRTFYRSCIESVLTFSCAGLEAWMWKANMPWI